MKNIAIKTLIIVSLLSVCFASAGRVLAQASPLDAEGYFNLGVDHAEAGRYQEAIEAFKQAIKLKPDDAEAYNNLGFAYNKLGRLQEAIEAYKQAIKLKPDYAEAHNNLGNVYNKLGRYQEAIDTFKQTIKLKPDLVEAHYNSGIAYKNLGRWEEAIEAFKQAIKLKPDFAEAYNNLGVAYYKLDRYQEAIEAYKQAIKLKPDHASARNNLEMAYLKIGDKGSADNVTGPVTDIDGNVYQTVKIGNQVWMTENLRTTKYNDGTAIPLVTDMDAWADLAAPGYCYYANTTDTRFIKKYGALYNWYAVDTKKLAPKGWHVPTAAEWDTMQNYLMTNGYNWDGTTTGDKIAKSLATKTDWDADTNPGTIGNDLSKNNKSGFSALPGGYREGGGYFDGVGYFSYWWNATEYNASYALYRILYYDQPNLLLYGTCRKDCGFSVRLLRDN
jgi:uncharacterized protein (TIGR02145 family)